MFPLLLVDALWPSRSNLPIVVDTTILELSRIGHLENGSWPLFAAGLCCCLLNSGRFSKQKSLSNTTMQENTQKPASSFCQMHKQKLPLNWDAAQDQFQLLALLSDSKLSCNKKHCHETETVNPFDILPQCAFAASHSTSLSKAFLQMEVASPTCLAIQKIRTFDAHSVAQFKSKNLHLQVVLWCSNG